MKPASRCSSLTRPEDGRLAFSCARVFDLKEEGGGGGGANKGKRRVGGEHTLAGAMQNNCSEISMLTCPPLLPCPVFGVSIGQVGGAQGTQARLHFVKMLEFFMYLFFYFHTCGGMFLPTLLSGPEHPDNTDRLFPW